jgi:YhcH/YjgK/YiaL family protein
VIATDLAHAERQLPPTPGLRRALAFLARADLADLPDGRVAIDGERVFALVQRYTTVQTDAPRFEAHRRYCDVQFVVAGQEIIGWAPLERLQVTEPYDATREACFGTVAAADVTGLRLGAGQFVVLYPEDAHAPKLAAGSAGQVVKIVVKVAVEP